MPTILKYAPKTLKHFERAQLFDVLTPEGQAFVDRLALELEVGLRRRNGRVIFGLIGGRELAMALLEHCWCGLLPEEAQDGCSVDAN